jgi:hypothetical protein
MADMARRRYAAIGIAAGGVLAGHWLTYLMDVPDAGRRAEILAGTGHAYLSVAGELATALVAVSIVVLFLGRLMAPRASPTSWRTLAVRLAMLQVGAFASMEVLERLTAGAGLGDLLRSAILPSGVAINVGIALIGAVGLRWILRLADRVAASIPGSGTTIECRRVTLGLTGASAVWRRRHPGLAALSVRGPPLHV